LISGCSDFGDIFDVRHFVESLQDDIQVVEELPADLAQIDPMMKAPVSWSKVTFSLSLCLSVSLSVSPFAFPSPGQLEEAVRDLS
jgi:hypothetical protein